MYENIEKSKFFVRKKARPFFSSSKSANFVLELFRHIILGQNEQIKKMHIFTVWAPEFKKFEKS